MIWNSLLLDEIDTVYIYSFSSVYEICDNMVRPPKMQLKWLPAKKCRVFCRAKSSRSLHPVELWRGASRAPPCSIFLEPAGVQNLCQLQCVSIQRMLLQSLSLLWSFSALPNMIHLFSPADIFPALYAGYILLIYSCHSSLSQRSPFLLSYSN